MKKYEPIGCRDLRTVKLLKNNGVKAYFSGCLTTTLDNNYLINATKKRTNKIYLIDFKFGEYHEADRYLNKLIKYKFSEAIHLSHVYPVKLTHNQRFNEAKKLLKKYSKAKLIITTRIHVALPCLGLHTPVILINEKYDHYRFDGLYELLNTIGKNEKDIYDYLLFKKFKNIFHKYFNLTKIRIVE